MKPRTIRFGIIGLGLMGREFASAAARWCHILDLVPQPELIGICDTNEKAFSWYQDHISSIVLATGDYKALLASDDIEAVYCAVPHNLHEQIYIDIIQSGKHLLGEKPFGIHQKANKNILAAIRSNPDVLVRSSSEFPYFPGAQRIIKWIEAQTYGRIIEVRAGFHHASDMDLAKPINWKRMVEINGEYGCMGDLGLHTQHIPFRMGWTPEWVFADLQNIAETRPDESGNIVPCETWDNAVLTCRCTDAKTGKPFSMVLETKRMAPGATNNWFIEVYGTEGSARFSTHDPKAFYYSETIGKEQPWSRIDLGYQAAFSAITGGIFEFGFSDALQQMIAAFTNELSDNPVPNILGCVTPEETEVSHKLLTAALKSNQTGKREPL